MEKVPKYNCPRCHYSTDNNSHFIRHIKKKTPCTSLYSDVSAEEIIASMRPDKAFKCEKCSKSFTQASNLYRHKKTHVTDNPNEPTIAINNTTDSHDNITTNNINENSHNTNVIIENINLTVHILPFGKEDISSIQNDMEFMNRCVQAGIEKAIPAIVKQIFLNENLPQNHNVKLGKEHHPAEMKVYKADIATGVPAWELAPRSQVLQELVDKGATVLQTHNNLLLNTSDDTQEAKENYDRRNNKIIDVKSKKRGTAKVKQAVLSKFREQTNNASQK